MEAGHEIRYNECKRCNEQKSHYCRKGRYYKIVYKEDGTW